MAHLLARKTPYMTSAGGIVGMSLKHWRAINGFGNNYFGWGGEDDELHHRLRLNGLLYGETWCQRFFRNWYDLMVFPKVILRRA